MGLINKLLEKCEPAIEMACQRLSKFCRSQQTFYAEGSPYLTRHYFTKRSTEGRLFGVYLHYFHMGDPDASLHNHPFKTSFSFILTNGYLEERWNPDTNQVDTNVVRPGDFNLIRQNDFHRVDLRNPTKGAWTIFFSGTKISDWGFWWPDVHSYIPHQDYIRSRENALKYRS